jgi:hypothetical protein
MDSFIDSNDVFWKSILQIKNTLDPNHILSQGRYCLKKE